ncbi:MAG TPA: response regulator transcription factor [Gemmataceae bacterium]|nr:response regulator transcription factor [Gemmataceae bacterium]
MRAPRTILLVEDQTELREAIAFVLRCHGYTVVTSGDGVEAAELAGRESLDLAVIDMMLPGLSGFQLTQRVKEQSNGLVPVIMISGNSSAAHQDYAHASGVDLFLAKPFPLHALADAARALCPPAIAAGSRTTPLVVGSRP